MNVFVIAMPGCGNLGDDLISVNLVKKIIEKWPKAKIGILCGCERILFKYPKAAKTVFIYDPKLHSRNYLRDLKNIRNFLKKANLILVGGGGLFQDSHSFFTPHNWMKYLFLTDCPAIAVGVGFGPINNKLNKFYLTKTLKRFSIIQVRDVESKKFVERLGYKANLSIDIVLGTDIKESEVYSAIEREKILGCSIRPWLNMDFEKLCRIISFCCEKRHFRTIYFFVFENSGQNHEEYIYAKKIKTKLSEEGYGCHVYCYGKDKLAIFFNAFSKVSYAIAVRYHANILWQKIGVHVMPISYAPKVTSLYGSCIDVKDLNNVIKEKDDKLFKQLKLNEKYNLPPNVDKLRRLDIGFKVNVFVVLVELVSLISRTCYGFFWRFKRICFEAK